MMNTVQHCWARRSLRQCSVPGKGAYKEVLNLRLPILVNALTFHNQLCQRASTRMQCCGAQGNVVGVAVQLKLPQVAAGKLLEVL